MRLPDIHVLQVHAWRRVVSTARPCADETMADILSATLRAIPPPRAATQGPEKQRASCPRCGKDRAQQYSTISVACDGYYSLEFMAMKPVWVEFPHIPWGSLGWRMGAGEDYWQSWAKWFKELSAEERATYQTQWPESGRWTGFYAFIERKEMPPWALEQQRRTLAAAKPPEPDEERIEERYRFLWMRNHYGFYPVIGDSK